MDNIFYLVYSLCFYDPNQLNYNQFSEGGENAKKTLVLKVLKETIGKWSKEAKSSLLISEIITLGPFLYRRMLG